ncbi:hypothetical protein [Neomegalonema sp.]|uniref:hypothetical protein n=1 Tax=Neomegalonema sp. TaxID=2039713 RepID=UPI00260B3C9B|nr:hypothetical protein [Neomegalonema sp.]MDD2869745.1 hypothetical protein [Neomegalonema sp.]
MSLLTLPRRPRGRLSAAKAEEYAATRAAFCKAILEIRSRLDFSIGSRGWCYILEEHGLNKGDFDAAQALITDCRKTGELPLDICAEDDAREFINLEHIDKTTPEDEAAAAIDYISRAHTTYRPFSFWRFQEFYVEALVEKADLKSLFAPVCREFNVPLANGRGSSDLNSRAAMMRRFTEHEAAGRQCVLLYAGDHDPAGLRISDFLLKNLADLSGATGWSPDRLIVDRFGLNDDFIAAHKLTWIENLETGSGGRLDDPRHPDHAKSYVQDYLRKFGARKVEANALVTRPEAGRRLCREAILKYVDAGAARDAWIASTKEAQAAVATEITRRLPQFGGQA